MNFVTTQEIDEMVYVASVAAFSKFISHHDIHDIYTLGLWTDDSLQFLSPCANTKSGLSETVKRYNKEFDPKYGTISTMESMRWCYGDWVHFATFGEEEFVKVNEAIGAIFRAKIRHDEYGGIIDDLWPGIISGFKRCGQEIFGKLSIIDPIALLIVGDLCKEFTDIDSYICDCCTSNASNRSAKYEG